MSGKKKCFFSLDYKSYEQITSHTKVIIFMYSCSWLTLQIEIADLSPGRIFKAAASQIAVTVGGTCGDVGNRCEMG